MISTFCPRLSSPRSRRPCRAANPEMGTAAACSWLSVAGLRARLSSGAHAYSAKDPSHQPNTSSPGRNRLTLPPTASTRPGDVHAPNADLGSAQPEIGDNDADQVRQAGHDVPVASVQASRTHPDQHLVPLGCRPVDVPELQDIRGAVLVLDDGLHRGLRVVSAPWRAWILLDRTVVKRAGRRRPCSTRGLAGLGAAAAVEPNDARRIALRPAHRNGRASRPRRGMCGHLARTHRGWPTRREGQHG
jgi:hypothetical protein